MTHAKILRIYLDNVPRERAERGAFNIMNRIQNAFEGQGFKFEYRKNSTTERAKSATRRGYSLFYMDEPFHSRSLTLRKAYFYPFWRIENSAKRWEWEIAKSPFEPENIDAEKARSFFNTWRRRVLPDLDDQISNGGYVYVPLQGRLLERRSFQSMSPMDMIQAVLSYDTSRQIIITLHPAEVYTPEELEALKQLVDRSPNLLLSKQKSEILIAGCDYIVTQNSGVALMGYLARKPAVLFGEIDFHHIAANAHRDGAEAALSQVLEIQPDYEKYIYWFLFQTAINGGSEHAETQILESVRKFGWNI